jgi:hypothetical protein
MEELLPIVLAAPPPPIITTLFAPKVIGAEVAYTRPPAPPPPPKSPAPPPPPAINKNSTDDRTGMIGEARPGQVAVTVFCATSTRDQMPDADDVDTPACVEDNMPP